MINLAVLLEDSAREAPAKTAIIFNDMKLPYAAVNAAANQIANGLVGLGIQLGSIGLFGKGAQNAINAPKAFALGTNYAPGGLALVGERGPELVNLPRGSTVTPNHRLGAGGVTNNYFSGNLMTPEFWARIHAGDAQAAQAGVQGGLQQLRYMNSRRWAG